MMSLDNNIKAIFLIILGMFVFSIQDTLIKLMSDSINIYVIYLVRSTVGVLVILTYCWQSSGDNFHSFVARYRKATSSLS